VKENSNVNETESVFNLFTSCWLLFN